MTELMQYNQQLVEKVVLRDDGALEIVGRPFHTIQGEGPFAGCPAVFVRTAGCVYQCPLCDTDYTSNRRTLQVEQLVDEVLSEHKGPTLVVVTGGEPFRQNLLPLVDRLLMLQYRVQIETSGALWQKLPYEDITVVCSPKADHIHPKLRPNAWKYVVRAGEVDPHDGLPTTVLGMNVRPARPVFLPRDGSIGSECPTYVAAHIYVQPVDEQDAEQNKRNMEQAVKSCMQYGYRFGLQMHKIAGLA